MHHTADDARTARCSGRPKYLEWLRVLEEEPRTFKGQEVVSQGAIARGRSGASECVSRALARRALALMRQSLRFVLAAVLAAGLLPGIDTTA